MTPAMHQISTYGGTVIENFLLSIDQLSKEATELRSSVQFFIAVAMKYLLNKHAI